MVYHTLLLLLFFSASLQGKPIDIVAAENFYGEIAQEIGGPYVSVVSILSNPSQDPHLFSTSADTAIAVAKAELIVYNGIDYDPWMNHLIESSGKAKVLEVARLLGKKPGDNPHIWYDPKTMLLYSFELAKELGELDEPHREYYQQQLNRFTSDYAKLSKKIEEIKQRYQGTPVIATEPVFNYMAMALGLKMEGLNLQISIMNDTAPSARDLIEFENKLNKREVKLMIFNKQVENPTTERLKQLARTNRIPLVPVTEIEPPSQSYLHWMLEQLDDIERGLTVERH